MGLSDVIRPSVKFWRRLKFSVIMFVYSILILFFQTLGLFPRHSRVREFSSHPRHLLRMTSPNWGPRLALMRLSGIERSTSKGLVVTTTIQAKSRKYGYARPHRIRRRPSPRRSSPLALRSITCKILTYRLIY
ncbi:hypothetical protein BDV39DRAFT_117188 [Aspergillus sergii]|uniref:Uncharacterized protein n=1 Tax=Aspergillus sergii TaxID=1034303 RepID=A0A5N6WXI0_9EURO|nr:hypothetical protein BDV39DRAFT_117188 [Aspergillus sergii]